MRIPRRAGRYAAIVATANNTSAVTPNVQGSNGSMPNNNCSSTRVSAPAASSPTATPASTRSSAWPMTRRNTDAPRAHRVGHHAVDADGGEDQRHQCEDAHEQRHRAWTRDGRAHYIVERPNLD